MKIIVGHSNMDLDCLGSMALARYIYPDHKLVVSRLIHPVAKNLFNLYQNHLTCIYPEDLEGTEIDDIVIVDTRSRKRVDEYFRFIPDFTGKISIWDHHPAETQDIEADEIHQAAYGSNTTLIGLELIKRNSTISVEDATIGLAGIYADTGNFTHENVRSEDFEVASYLLKNGASVAMVKNLLKVLKEKYQITLFHEILNRLTYKTINGNLVLMSYIEIENNESGLAAVVEKIFEIENPDAIFCVFHVTKSSNTMIIARSKLDSINLNGILAEFGGSGHSKAASALVKKKSGMMVYGLLEEHLKSILEHAIIASDIMEKNVLTVNEEKSLIDASKLMESKMIGGLPVVSKVGQLVGYITLRDIMKGRKNNAMDSPVKCYMSRNLVTADGNTTIREVEAILYSNNIGHLPIVKGKSIVGLVTRSHLLDFFKEHDPEKC
ncbi:MAG: CBS domain-containing protein [Spirochaetes bacterium]|nr:CBS domain-containing protein [Spirochaetota bacterium]